MVCPEPRAADYDVIADIEEAFGTKVYLCQLDNEIDRMKALERLDSNSLLPAVP